MQHRYDDMTSHHQQGTMLCATEEEMGPPDLVHMQIERERLMQDVSDRYGKSSTRHLSAMQIQGVTHLLDTMQTNLYSENLGKLGSLNSDLLTNDRIAMILREEYGKIYFRTGLLHLTMIFASLIVIALSIGLSFPQFAQYCLMAAGALGVLWVLVFATRFLSTLNNYRLLSEEKSFSPMPAPATATAGTTPCTSCPPPVQCPSSSS